MQINDQYIMKKRISQGSFGVVYVGQDVHTKQYVAIKIEKTEKAVSLEREAMFLQHLHGIPQIPRLFYIGKANNQTSMVIQFLGRDLTHHIRQYRKFTLKCILNIADQLLTILENIHMRSVIHRDIKPENILCGRDNDPHLYLVDFGISKFYRDKRGIHLPYSDKKSFLGTSRYASLSAHLGHELGRKDDLESLGYVLIYLYKGQLPWQQIKYTEEEKVRVVGEMKQKLPLQELCKGMPEEFYRYLDYTRRLDFKAAPDYKYLRSMFQKLAQQNNYGDSRFDWDSSIPSLMLPSDNASLLKRSRRPTDLAKPKSHSTFNDPLSGNSFLKMPDQISSGNKLCLSPETGERASMRKLSNGSMNETYSCNKSGFVSVIGNPSHQSNITNLSFDIPVFNFQQDSMSPITKIQLNTFDDDDKESDKSPSPLISKIRKLISFNSKVHFKQTLVKSETTRSLQELHQQ